VVVSDGTRTAREGTYNAPRQCAFPQARIPPVHGPAAVLAPEEQCPSWTGLGLGSVQRLACCEVAVGVCSTVRRTESDS
jgi:hypothetical protein